MFENAETPRDSFQSESQRFARDRGANPMPVRQAPIVPERAYVSINEALSDKRLRVRFRGLRDDTLWFWLADREKPMTEAQLTALASHIVTALRDAHDPDIEIALGFARQIGLE